MSEQDSSTERNRNIWAPWRMEYIDALNEKPEGCFLCRYRDDPASDERNFVMWRGEKSFGVLNRFPYTGGHSMIAPLAHVADMTALDDATMLEMFRYLRDMQRILQRALHADGFNVGINIGRCAGAGLPGHLHVHIVPRWSGDTNFMAVLGGVRVVPQTLGALREAILKAGKELNLPDFAHKRDGK